jgi:hypothetical protein
MHTRCDRLSFTVNELTTPKNHRRRPPSAEILTSHSQQSERCTGSGSLYCAGFRRRRGRGQRDGHISESRPRLLDRKHRNGQAELASRLSPMTRFQRSPLRSDPFERSPRRRPLAAPANRRSRLRLPRRAAIRPDPVRGRLLPVRAGDGNARPGRRPGDVRGSPARRKMPAARAAVR